MKRKNFTILLLLSLSLTANAFAADTWTVRDNGVGPVWVGMTLAQMKAALHQKLAEEESGSEGCFYVHARGHDHVGFMMIDGRLARIDVDAPGIFTASGIQVGDPETKAQRTYGARMKTSEHKYIDTGHYLTVRANDHRYGIRFETDKGKITMFYVGTYEAIQYVEGCE